MGKMLDPKNVTTRADRMMRDHLAAFEEYFGNYENDGSCYCFEYNENTSMKVYYENSSKFLTKTFSTTVKITLQNIVMKTSWKAKLSLHGKVKVEKLSLKATDQDSKEMVEKLNENAELIEKMLKLFKNFDLQSLSMEYDKDEVEMNILLKPYPGAFIWVKIPPIYYDVRLKKKEVERIYEITGFFSTFFSKNLQM